MTKRDTFVYRAYDADSHCLYVGVTKNLKNRRADHRTNSRWYKYAVHFRISGPYLRRKALDIETAEIRRIAPIFNRKMNEVTPDRTYWRLEIDRRQKAWREDHRGESFSDYVKACRLIEQQVSVEAGRDLVDTDLSLVALAHQAEGRAA